MKSLEEWAFAGLSQKEMAEMLGMAYSTFRELRKKIPALSALLKKSADFLKAEQKKEVEKVEVSLLNRCLGYNADIKKHMKVKKPMQGADGKVLTDANGKVITEEVLAATKNTAFMYMEEGIRCNALSPGGVVTDIPLVMPPADEFGFGRTSKLLDFSGELAMPEDLADAILFLASDQSRYVNGEELKCDGGWTCF